MTVVWGRPAVLPRNLKEYSRAQRRKDKGRVRGGRGGRLELWKKGSTSKQ